MSRTYLLPSLVEFIELGLREAWKLQIKFTFEIQMALEARESIELSLKEFSLISYDLVALPKNY